MLHSDIHTTQLMQIRILNIYIDLMCTQLFSFMNSLIIYPFSLLLRLFSQISPFICRYNAKAMVTFNSGAVLEGYLIHTTIAGATNVGDEVNFGRSINVVDRDYSFGAVVTSG